MRAMILAAGRGERMRPLTNTLPKPLLPVGGKPLIVWHIERLAKAGLREIVINHAWLGHKIPQTLGDGSAFGVHLYYSAEEEGGLETAGGIANALPLLGTEPFLVINGDIWCDWDPTQAWALRDTLYKESKKAWLLMVKNPAHHLEGDFHLDSTGLLYSEGVPKLTFAGIGIYHPELFAGIAPKSFVKLAPILRQAMQKQQVVGTYYDGQWTDVGTPARLYALDAQLNTQHQ